MADAVQQRLEAGLEELHALTQRQVLSEEETREILRRRRDFEFECSGRHGETVRAFLVYIHYEVNLLTLLRLRCRASLDAARSQLQELQQQQRLLRRRQQQQKKNKQQQTRQKEREKIEKTLKWQQQQQQRHHRLIRQTKDLLHAVVRTGSRRVYKLCRRLLQRHSTSLTLWYSCLDLLLQLGSTRQLQQLLLHALRQFPRCAGLWLLAAERLLQQGQLLAARRLLLTALRVNSSSVALWTELLRLEAATVLRKAKALQQQQQEAFLSASSPPEPAGGSSAGESTATEQEAAREENKADVAVERRQQVQGDAILVVFRAAVGKLQQQRPRRQRETVAAAAVEEENSACSSSSSTLQQRAIEASKLQNFLLQALELCLGLQASEVAPLIQDDLLPTLQQQLSVLLHEQAQQQPLLRVYEWKVLLLQAVAEAVAPAEGSSSAQSSSSSNTETKDAVSHVLEDMLEECQTRPHLLLLLALFLRGLLSSSSKAATTAAADKQKTLAAVGAAGAEDDVLCVLDVEGEEADDHALNSGSSSSRNAADLNIGSQLLQLYGGAHADADLSTGSSGGALEDAFYAAEATASTDSAEEKMKIHDVLALRQLKMLSTAGWPQVMLLLQRQPRIGRACLLLLLQEEMKAGPAADTGGLLAEPQLLQLQRETLWNALWNSSTVPPGDADAQLLQRRLWLLQSLLHALQQQMQQKQMQQQQQRKVKHKKCGEDKSSKPEKAAKAAARAGAFIALGQLLLELLERAAADVEGSAVAEVKGYLKSLEQLQQNLQQLVEGFLRQQQQHQETEPAALKQQEQHVAQLLLLLLEVQTRSLPCGEEALWEDRQQQQQAPPPKRKKTLQPQQEAPDETEEQQNEQRMPGSMAAAINVLKTVRTSSLGVQDASRLLERFLSEQKKNSSSRTVGSEEEAEEEKGKDDTVEVLPTWFQELLAAAAPTTVPVLVRRFCQHCLAQQQLLLRRQLEQQQQQQQSEAVVEKVGIQQPQKRRKLLLLQQQMHRQSPFCEVRRTPAAREAVTAAPPASAAPAEAKTKNEVQLKAAAAAGAFSAAPVLIEVAAVLQWSAKSVSTLNSRDCCLRLCNAARLAVFLGICEFAVGALWRCISRCWVSGTSLSCGSNNGLLLSTTTPAALTAGAAGEEEIDSDWLETMKLLLQQSREVYVCALAAYERCGVQQQLLQQDGGEGGRGKRLQQQGQVLRRHVLQQFNDACQQQSTWWINFWRYCQFCEEVDSLVRLQQHCSYVSPHHRPAQLLKQLLNTSITPVPVVAPFSRGVFPDAAARRHLSAAIASKGIKGISIQKREEAARQAEQALGEGSAALAAFREALAAEVAAPCQPQHQYPGGCTACGVARLWCRYSAIEHNSASPQLFV